MKHLEIRICEYCGKEHDGTHATGRFCSMKCSHGFVTKEKRQEINKKVSEKLKGFKNTLCYKCGQEIIINKCARNKSICNFCKEENNKCKICGQQQCLKPEICKKYQLFQTLIKNFGFDKNKIGTIEVYEEFEKIRNLLVEDYWDKELSCSEINIKYKNNCNLYKIFNSLNINRRTFSECSTLQVLKNGSNGFCNNKYKHGWHIDWQNKKHFYRSSYELDYYKILDEQKSEYETEKLRILYWDSQILKQRIAIPDIFVKQDNLIIEVKSTYTYNEQNMKDKVKSYKEHGYNFKLILEHEEIK